jgi:hypothetical protein
MTKELLIALGAVLAILALTALVWFFFGPADAKAIFDGMFGAIVGGLITAVVTLVLIFIGLQQVHQLANISNADFMLRRADKFFQPETRKLIQLIEDAYLRFEERNPFRDSYFVPDEVKITNSGLHNDLKQSLLAGRAYSTYEIDDLILGPLEDLGALEADKRGLISFDLIYDFFSWYICRIWENEEIKRYVNGARKERRGAVDLYRAALNVPKLISTQVPIDIGEVLRKIRSILYQRCGVCRSRISSGPPRTVAPRAM